MNVKKSYRVQSRGNEELGRLCKESRKNIVKLATDDLEVSFGLYLGFSKGGYRKIATMHFEDRGRRQVWEVLTIDPERIKSITILS